MSSGKQYWNISPIDRFPDTSASALCSDGPLPHAHTYSTCLKIDHSTGNLQEANCINTGANCIDPGGQFIDVLFVNELRRPEDVLEQFVVVRV